MMTGSAHISIGNKRVGEGNAPFIIAEVAQAHEGSLGLALSFIEAAAKAGADAIKFQTHIAAAESTRDEKFRIEMSGQDASRYEYWKRMEFTPDQWHKLKTHADKHGIIFLSSAFSVEAVELLEAVGMPAWKVGSGEFKSRELLDAMVKTGKPVLYSTGMSNYQEVEDAAQYFTAQNIPHALFQCTSAYPTTMDVVGLNVLREFSDKYGCPVGLSDHSGTVFPVLAAMAQGAHLIEFHVTFDRAMYGPDAVASLTFSELEFVCKARDAFFTMASNPVNKDDMARSMKTMRGLFAKSIALARDLPAGTVLQADMLCPKKPGTGIAYTDKKQLIGRTLAHDVPSDRLLMWEDVVSE
jgi:N,N'-diacetyllegionaminate synthase